MAARQRQTATCPERVLAVLQVLVLVLALPAVAYSERQRRALLVLPPQPLWARLSQ